MREAAESGKEETKADFRGTAISIYFVADNFSAHSKCSK